MHADRAGGWFCGVSAGRGGGRGVLHANPELGVGVTN